MKTVHWVYDHFIRADFRGGDKLTVFSWPSVGFRVKDWLNFGFWFKIFTIFILGLFTVIGLLATLQVHFILLESFQDGSWNEALLFSVLAML